MWAWVVPLHVAKLDAAIEPLASRTTWLVGTKRSCTAGRVERSRNLSARDPPDINPSTTETTAGRSGSGPGFRHRPLQQEVGLPRPIADRRRTEAAQG
jgi:hypothetical protein